MSSQLVTLLICICNDGDDDDDDDAVADEQIYANDRNDKDTVITLKL